MSEQIMWAVKGPSGVLQKMEYGLSEDEGWRLFAFSCNVDCKIWWIEAMEAKGYRCIRVRITEVQDGA